MMQTGKLSWLIIGDVFTLGIVTLIGFASHGTLDSAGMRVLTTFLPLLAGWFLIAPHLKVYDLEVVGDLRQLWRPIWSMVLAAPFAAWLRGAWLDSPILPVFVLVLGGISALAILFWRFLYWIVFYRLKSADG